MNKWYYIGLISDKSDKYGNLLLELMERNNRYNLQEVTEQEAKYFYEELIRNEKEN